MNGLDHAIEDGVEQQAGFFGVAVREQLQRSFHIGEEDGDLLALPLDGGPLGEDALGQMARGVVLGRCEPRKDSGGIGRRPDGSTASVAKLAARFRARATGGTARTETAATVPTEARVVTIPSLTTRTLHHTISSAA
ncbi:MAG TPA: hypothetical protein VIE36_16170 [Methylomirabilota bacterium]